MSLVGAGGAGVTLDNSRSNSASVSVSSVSPASPPSSASPESTRSAGSVGSVDSVDSTVEVDTFSYRDSGYVSSGLAFRPRALCGPRETTTDATRPRCSSPNAAPPR
jgi:hypothetical protein